MGEIRDEVKYPLVALTSFGIGFTLGATAGRADLKTKEGWLRALGLSAPGSTITGLSAFGIPKLAGASDKFAFVSYGVWLVIQTLAGINNYVGWRYKLQEKRAYQAAAIPLNLAATPVVSTVGLLWGGIGMASKGFKGEVYAYGGLVVFEHQLCVTALTMGVASHCIKARGAHPEHEWGHQIQYSIMGEPGILAVAFFDFITDPKTAVINNRAGARTLEPWAAEFSDFLRKPIVLRGPALDDSQKERKHRHKDNSKNDKLKIFSDNRNVSKKISSE